MESTMTMVVNNPAGQLDEPTDWSLEEAIGLRVKIEEGRASPDESDMWRLVKCRYEAKYWRGDLSERSARQLGLIA
jgi:hypothetical protein